MILLLKEFPSLPFCSRWKCYCGCEEENEGLLSGLAQIPWPDGKGFGPAHYLTFIRSLLQILSSQKEAKSMKPAYSVVLSLVVHTHFSGCGIPPPPQAPEGMGRRELIIRLVRRRAHNAARRNQRIAGEHHLLKGHLLSPHRPSSLRHARFPKRSNPGIHEAT